MKLETALLLIPPLNVQYFAAPIRARFAPTSFPLVPAHITIMYPFVDLDRSRQAVRILHEHCRSIQPFDVTLDRYGHFPNAIYLEPEDPEPILQLYRSIYKVFPDYMAYGGAFGGDLHPHLTVAELAKEVDPATVPLPPIPALRFKADRIYFYAGITDTDCEGQIPFIPLSVIPLGDQHDPGSE